MATAEKVWLVRRSSSLDHEGSPDVIAVASTPRRAREVARAHWGTYREHLPGHYQVTRETWWPEVNPTEAYVQYGPPGNSLFWDTYSVEEWEVQR